MSVPEARVLLRDLNEQATQREFVYVHKWTLHDLVMWDNRQTMHRVRRYDQSQPRDMRRATVAGTAPTVAQQAAEWDDEVDVQNTSSSLRKQGPIRRAVSCEIVTLDKRDGATIAITIGYWDYGSLRSQGRHRSCIRRARLRSTACPDRSRSCAARGGIFRRHRRRRSDQ